MSPIDERGRLFGRVNVYDAAVVVVVVLVVAAGLVAVVDPFAADEVDDPSVTRYATIDLGEQSPGVASRLAEGDTDGGLTVTDTYVGPAAGENVSVFVRVRIEGQLDGDRFEYAGYPVSAGARLDIETDGYEVDGEVIALDRENGSLQTTRTPVVVETTLSSAATIPVERNDTYRIDDRTVGRVTSVTAEPATGGGNRTAVVGLSLVTISDGGRTYFGDSRLLVGRSVPFRTDSYAIAGRVVRLGPPAASVENRTVTVELDGVDPEVADGYEVGLVERTAGTTTARVTGVRTTETASSTGSDGPRRVDVTLIVELRVRETDDGPRFRTRPLREGSAIVFDFGRIVADGTVTDIGRRQFADRISGPGSRNTVPVVFWVA